VCCGAPRRARRPGWRRGGLGLRRLLPLSGQADGGASKLERQDFFKKIHVIFFGDESELYDGDIFIVMIYLYDDESSCMMRRMRGTCVIVS
jgi:hypothetical protein